MLENLKNIFCFCKKRNKDKDQYGTIEDRIENVSEKTHHLNTRLDRKRTRIEDLESRMSNVFERLDYLENGIEKIFDRFGSNAVMMDHIVNVIIDCSQCGEANKARHRSFAELVKFQKASMKIKEENSSKSEGELYFLFMLKT